MLSSVALPHQRRSASKNTAFKFNTRIYSTHILLRRNMNRNKSQQVHNHTAALLHGNASIPAGLEERLGSRLISHYRRLMFLPGAYKSTRPGRFHVRSGMLSRTSTGSLNSTCMFYMSEIGHRVCIYWSVTGLRRGSETGVNATLMSETPTELPFCLLTA